MSLRAFHYDVEKFLKFWGAVIRTSSNPFLIESHKLYSLFEHSFKECKFGVTKNLFQIIYPTNHMQCHPTIEIIHCHGDIGFVAKGPEPIHTVPIKILPRQARTLAKTVSWRFEIWTKSYRHQRSGQALQVKMDGFDHHIPSTVTRDRIVSAVVVHQAGEGIGITDVRTQNSPRVIPQIIFSPTEV